MGNLWEDFTFIVSSEYREKVFAALAPKPRLPKQLSVQTKLRPAHVSRSLRELKDQGLVECLTTSRKARGRLYALTSVGYLVHRYMTTSHLPPSSPAPSGFAGISGFVPKVRAAIILRCIDGLARTKGEAVVRKALKDWSLPIEEITDDTWLSIAAFDEVLELMEAKFGDGSYVFLKQLFSENIVRLPTVKEQIQKGLPLELLAERAPIVYSMEWNYGRLEVKTGHRRASFLHYDWNPSPALCAMLEAVYSGVLRAHGVPGKVSKTRCVRRGDDRCEYVVEW